MIKIERQDEPPDFAAKVRQPGLAYLNGLGVGEKPRWKEHSYWRRAKKDMLDAYGGICAYACCEISPRSSAYDALLQEALVTARSFDYQGVETKVMLAEYLAAICVKTGRMKDKLRVNMFLSGEDFDIARFKGILSKFNLAERFEQWQA